MADTTPKKPKGRRLFIEVPVAVAEYLEQEAEKDDREPAHFNRRLFMEAVERHRAAHEFKADSAPEPAGEASDQP
jgi:hypothetical protein